MTRITIVDYGVGNLASVANMIRKAGGVADIVDRPEALDAADKLLFPGVGAWDAAMDAIVDRGFREPLLSFAASGRPLLGICLGMQLLFEASEEGTVPGLGLLGGRLRRFDSSQVRVPHMGWNNVTPAKPSPLFPAADAEQRFYFAHSYFALPSDPADVAATVDYGGRFACAFARGNIFGTQFHPEKSHRFGLGLFQRFLAVA